MCVCVFVKNILKMWPLEFQCGFLKMQPGSHSGFLKLTSSAHRGCSTMPVGSVPKPTRPLSILPTRPLFLPWILTNLSPKSINSKSVISCCCVGIYFNNAQ